MWTRNEGLTLIEILMAIALMGILAALIPSAALSTIQEGRVERTRRQLEQIRNAIIGDSTLKERGVRTQFGFVGDMGRIPTALSELLVQPAGSAAYAMDSTVRFAHGWNGPYMRDDSVADWQKDAWGNALIYTAGSGVAPTTISSYGADGAEFGTGFDSDITIQVDSSMVSFTVFGVLSDPENPTSPGIPQQFSSTAKITLHELDGNGNLKSPATETTADGYGAFRFDGVSTGRRAITVQMPDPSPTATVGPVTVVPDGPVTAIPWRKLVSP